MDQETLAEVFIQQAEWRDEKATEYKHDTRNIEAAAHLRHLAETAKNIDDALINAAVELSEDVPDTEAWNEMLRQEGFHTKHESAEAFLRTYISNRSSGR